MRSQELGKKRTHGKLGERGTGTKSEMEERMEISEGFLEVLERSAFLHDVAEVARMLVSFTFKRDIKMMIMRFTAEDCGLNSFTPG